MALVTENTKDSLNASIGVKLLAENNRLALEIL